MFVSVFVVVFVVVVVVVFVVVFNTKTEKSQCFSMMCFIIITIQTCSFCV